MADLTAVGVVGGGIMGAGIAEVAARSGCDVVLREVDGPAADAARRRIEHSLDKAVTSRKLGPDDRDGAAARISYVTDLAAFADREIVIEAVIEDEALKTQIFRDLDHLTPDGRCVLASNTSSIPIMKLAAVTRRPERVVGLHFFNPVPVLALVEIVPSLATGPATVDLVRAFATARLGKRAVLCQDRAGFVVNGLLIPYLLAGIRMVEAGVATAEDVDVAMVAGCAHPMGPLALADLIGLDTTVAVANSLYAEFKEPLYAPPSLLLRMVEAGRFGRKSGHGFYKY